MVFLGACIFGYYWHQNKYYIKTDDSRIAAATIIVSPQITGKITSWTAQEGSIVKAGQTLGRQDTNSVASSSAISVKTLPQTGSMSISKAEIVAPVTGQIIKTAVQEGEIVNPNQTLAIIANTNDIYISANIEENKISRIRIGQPVDITIDSVPGQTFQGKVSEIGQATASTFSIISAQNSSGTFTKVTQLIPIKIRFPIHPDLQLLPGISAEIRIHLAE